MISFEEFWNNSKNSPDSVNSPELSTVLAISSVITTGVQQIIVPVGALVFGLNDQQAKEERFSNEVANYITSDEVISSLSKEIGEPKTNETEQEFVERASRVLKAIIQKKFNV